MSKKKENPFSFFKFNKDDDPIIVPTTTTNTISSPNNNNNSLPVFNNNNIKTKKKVDNLFDDDDDDDDEEEEDDDDDEDEDDNSKLPVLNKQQPNIIVNNNNSNKPIPIPTPTTTTIRKSNESNGIKINTNTTTTTATPSKSRLNKLFDDVKLDDAGVGDEDSLAPPPSNGLPSSTTITTPLPILPTSLKIAATVNNHLLVSSSSPQQPMVVPPPPPSNIVIPPNIDVDNSIIESMKQQIDRLLQENTQLKTYAKQLKVKNKKMEQEKEVVDQRLLVAERTLEQFKIKEANETKIMEDMIANVEENLSATKKRAHVAEQQVEQLRYELQSYQNTGGSVECNELRHRLLDARDKGRMVSGLLHQAASDADNNIKNLLRGVETLQNISMLLTSIDKVSTV